MGIFDGTEQTVDVSNINLKVLCAFIKLFRRYQFNPYISDISGPYGISINGLNNIR